MWNREAIVGRFTPFIIIFRKNTMQKVLAEIIAGVIPFKMARNRWRGLLRYGVFKALRLRRQMRHTRVEPKHYLAVWAIAKNEGP